MIIFFPDTGAVRSIGYHDNKYYAGTSGKEHPHPAVSPDGTKVLLKSTHMSQLHGLEVMVVRPPRAPVVRLKNRILTWDVPEVNSEITAYRIFHSNKSGLGYQFFREVPDTRSPQSKLVHDGSRKPLSWELPPELQEGFLLVCSVEGSGLMSPPSNEVALTTETFRRIFVPLEQLITKCRTAYITSDGEAASWAVVRQAEVELRSGEKQPGDPHIRWHLPESETYIFFLRLRGTGSVQFGDYGSVTVDSKIYIWQRVGYVTGNQLTAVLSIDEGVRLDQICVSSDPGFIPAGNSPLDLTPDPPKQLRIRKREDESIHLSWAPTPQNFVMEYNVYAISGEQEYSQKWRLCTVKESIAIDWNRPPGLTIYTVTAIGWDKTESAPSTPVYLSS